MKWTSAGTYADDRSGYRSGLSRERHLEKFEKNVVKAGWWDQQTPGTKAFVVGAGALVGAWVLGWLTAPARPARAATTAEG